MVSNKMELNKQDYLKSLCRLQCGAKINKRCEECECYDNEINHWKCFENTHESLIIRDLIDNHFSIIDRIKSGELSDGYHTFNELYYHRAILFSIIVNEHKDISWKSKLHSDGTMYDGMFIVGIDTPKGQYSYHYNINLWSLFDCKEIDNAPKWDGHMPKDIDRLLTINDEVKK